MGRSEEEMAALGALFEATMSAMTFGDTYQETGFFLNVYPNRLEVIAGGTLDADVLSGPDRIGGWHYISCRSEYEITDTNSRRRQYFWLNQYPRDVRPFYKLTAFYDKKEADSNAKDRIGDAKLCYFLEENSK